jgi:O-antigen ligase
MVSESKAVAAKFWVVASFLFAVLFASTIWRTSTGFMGSIVREIGSAALAPATQWMVALCLVFYLIAFLLLEKPAERRSSCLQNSKVWLSAFTLLSFSRYILSYETALRSVQFVVLLAGVLIGKVLLEWGRRPHSLFDKTRWTLWVLGVLASLLATSAFYHTSSVIEEFQYRGTVRWSGLWENPNFYGSLMGVGIALSFGFVVSSFVQSQLPLVNCRSRLPFRLPLSVYWGSLSAILCGIGLIKSYSRGAWIATICAVIYLVWQVLKGLKSNVQGLGGLWLFRNRRGLTLIAFSLFVLTFWQFRFTEWRPARRVFSMANINDFSWGNRMMAWRGALRMMADRPWFGFGWGEAEAIYEKKYCPPQLESGAAIQMNDFFMLGISVGAPALLCFLAYVGLSLKSPRSMVQRLKSAESEATLDFEPWILDGLRATCRAGAIVLLVGFWFDGGLFKLATGSVFWILLELGRVDFHRGSSEAQSADLPIGVNQTFPKVQAEEPEFGASPIRRAQWENWLRRLAWALGIAAFVETSVLIGTPFLGVNNTSLGISRHYLVPPSAVADLNFLATNTSWNGVKLRVLLQHASLANYNRELINWKLEDHIYREYVLTPTISSERDGHLNWRRSLWEYFYPPTRKETEPAAAAEIVMKFLHERTTIVPKGPSTIEEMWHQKQADAKGFEALKVAAFRAVSVPARLNGNRQTELWSDGKWQTM